MKLLDAYFPRKADMHDHTTIKGIYLVMEHVKNDLESIIYDREKMLN